MDCKKCGQKIDTTNVDNLTTHGVDVIHKQCPDQQVIAEVIDTVVGIDVKGVAQKTTISEQQFLGNPAPVGDIVKVDTSLKKLSDKKPPAIKYDENSLTPTQEQSIEIFSYTRAIAGQDYSADAIHKAWPTTPRSRITNGTKPSIPEIQAYQGTEKYRNAMAGRGIELARYSELTVEQSALLHILSDISDTRGFSARLRASGIKPATYRGWLQQKAFAEAIKTLSGNALTEAIPAAEVNLAAKAAAGDLKAIQFMFEVTGRHDPARQQAVDTQALIGVIIDVMQETITQENLDGMTAPELLSHMQQMIKFRAQGVKGVING